MLGRARSVVVLSALVCFCVVTCANASIIFEISGSDFSLPAGGAPIPAANPLVMTFADNGANTVRLTIDPSGLPANYEKISDVWFNSLVGGLSFQYVSGVGASSTGPGGNVDGAGIFDWNFQYSTSGPAGSFHVNSGNSVYDITGSGLTENSFLKLTVPNDTPPGALYVAIHMNLGGNGQSAHYGTDQYRTGTGSGGVIPEPGSLIVWSLLGTLGLAVGCRRWTRKRA